jgi:oxygen-independent coproporphyrinogen-3 oxidase
VDLIAGGPVEPPEGAAGDVREAVAAGADHVSLYTLMLEPDTPLARRVQGGEVRLPSDEAVVRAVNAARRELQAAGFRRYEVSNYARPGAECRHNDAYWLLEPSIGVGPSAVSTLPGPDGTALRLTTKASTAEVETEFVSRRSFLLEHFMMGLRRADGLPPERFLRRFGAAPAEFAPETVSRWESEGVLRRVGDRLVVGDEGMWYLDSLLSEIAAELPPA